MNQRIFRVMISSRVITKLNKEKLMENSQLVDGEWILNKPKINLGKGNLEGIRYAIKSRYENFEFLSSDSKVTIWINEKADAHTIDQKSFEECLTQIKRCDLLIVLYTGEEGSKLLEYNNDGICYWEAKFGYTIQPETTFFVDIRKLVDVKPSDNSNKMQELFDLVQPFGAPIDSFSYLFKNLDQMIFSHMIYFANRGVTQTRSKGQSNRGQALEWSGLSLKNRAEKMRTSLVSLVENNDEWNATADGLNIRSEINYLNCKWNDLSLKIAVSAIPGSMTDPNAKAIWNRPELQDHSVIFEKTKPVHGPIHIVAVKGKVTEAQALKLINNPNAFVSSTKFGAWGADRIQGIAFIFLEECKDDLSTRIRFSEASDWLRANKTLIQMGKLAEKRYKVIKALQG